MQQISPADIVRRSYQAVNEADAATLAGLLDARAHWHTPGRSPVAGDRRGRAAVLAQFARYGRETEGRFGMALQDVLEGDGGRVVGIHRASGRRLGRSLNTGCCVVFQVREGRILSAREHFEDQQRWDDFWA